MRNPNTCCRRVRGPPVEFINRDLRRATTRALRSAFSLASGGSLTSPPFCYNESLAKAMAANIGVRRTSLPGLWVAFFQECQR